ncbi:hypothetical protein SLEP1_g23145 [Rubroshorea leprosula]|uniref:CCHC-type domain-containing protein n=1 Tax=Rubroshorea leprosula TaxID=152421 RepID=A0AAV5JKZ8_9ROSI|nr:hypothetical protein SLEP1_g23145 [Rubroshorea leprosula]
MADEEDGSTMIKLNTSNCSLWKTLIEDKLFCKDLYDPIEHKGIKPAKINDADWKKIDRKACGIICKWVDMSVIHHVAQEKESYKLWTKLEELFERKNALKKASLIRKLLAIDDEVQALILLSSLLNSWETLVVTLSNSTRDGEITLQLVKDSILSEESRRKEQGIMSYESEALVIEYRGRSKQRYTRRNNDRQSQERYNKGKSRDRSKSKSRVTCYTCGKQGLYQRDCWHNKDKNVRKKVDTHEEKEAKENIAAITFDGEVYLLCENDNIDVAHHDSRWVVDTAASYHVTPNRDWFSSEKKGDFGYLKMGNRSETKIVGVGDVWLETNIGSKLHLKNALKIVVYLINQSPFAVLNGGDVPKKVWLGKEVSYKHLREYAYRLWDLKNRKLMRTKDVVFIENETVEHSKKQDDSKHTQEIPDSDYCTPSTPKPSVMNDDHSEVDEQQVQEPVVEHFVEEETHQEEQVQPPQQPQVRRSIGLHQPSRKHSIDKYVLLTDGGEPETYYEAMESEKKKEWLMAMQEEMSSLQENGTYELVELPKDKKALNNKWVFRVKSEVNNPNPRFKAKLVLDVKTAFLHSDLEEEIYMKQPKGFEVQGKKNLVCKLKKSLYLDGDFLILLLYVDDMLIVGHDTKKIAALKTDLSKSFSMKDLGPAKQILGMKIFQDRKNKKLWLSQEKYIKKVLDRFNMSKAKPMGTPLASHFKLSTEQCLASKEEAEYMKNVPYASTVGSLTYAMKSVSLSTIKAKYIALSKAGKEIAWMKTFFEELGLKQERFVLFCDNQSAIYLSKNPQFHSRTKHVDLRYHWIRDAIEEKVLDVEKVHTDDNSSDMMTKSLVRSKFEFCRSQAGLVEPPN